ncbi:MAG: TauD/TfdA family dioxygenase [Lautropia sp.]
MDDDYRRWRDDKLAWADAAGEPAVVEIREPGAPSAAERAAIVDACARTNVSLYRWRPGASEAGERKRVASLAARLGLHRIDGNWLAGDDGISSLEVVDGAGVRGDFVPYTDRAIRWHTDGYYNPPERRIQAMLLHCCRRADSGGVNRMLDHELVYILLREREPALLEALCHPRAMTIPAREDPDGAGRDERAGPVFVPGPAPGAPGGSGGRARGRGFGGVHMRYTARTRSIGWRDDPLTQTAVKWLDTLLETATPWTRQVRLEPGMGIVCNNVLHDRSAFRNDGEHRRLILRARFLERVATTDRAEGSTSWTTSN